MLEQGTWSFELDAETDVALRLTFRDGVVFEAGMNVGRYAALEVMVRAFIGEDVTLLISEGDGSYLPVSRMTEHHGDGADIIEDARLVRDLGSH